MVCLLLAVAFGAPDVFLISVDTLRADRLGAYGSTLGATPALDAFCKEGLVFEDCVCEQPLTGPSFCSMMTSQYPRMLGVVQNGIPLAEGLPTAAVQFQNAGYETCCIQSNWPLRPHLCGLNRGFEKYDDGFELEQPNARRGQRAADEVTRLALDALRKRDGKRPLFMWVHYTDPHAPYRFHADFNPGGRRLEGLDTAGQIRVKYDSDVAFTDHHIGLFLKAIPKDNTFVVFVADHGESLLEHGYLGHGKRIYQESMHVPLVIRGPSVAPGRVRVPARGIDVCPTLLALAGLPNLPGMLGLNLLGPLPEDRVRVVETYVGDKPDVWQGVVHGDWKLVIPPGTGPQLFNLSDDPAENSNLAANEPVRLQELIAKLKEWDATVLKAPRAAYKVNKEDKKAFQALGYLR